MYRIALEFQAIAGQLVPKRGYAELRDQLERASISIVLNIAEGCGRRSPADKGRFYSMARGSATECAAPSTCCAPAGWSTSGYETVPGLSSSASSRCSVNWLRGWERSVSRRENRGAVVVIAGAVSHRPASLPLFRYAV